MSVLQRDGNGWAGIAARWGSLALAGVLSIAVSASAANADPSLDYILNCRGCHRPDGSGVLGGAPSFHGQLGKFLWVPGGREYLIRVPGVSTSELSNARIAALLNWMMRAFSPTTVPADFKPFTAAEVTRYRRPPLLNVQRTRRKLLRLIAARAAPAMRTRAAVWRPNDAHGARR